MCKQSISSNDIVVDTTTTTTGTTTRMILREEHGTTVLTPLVYGIVVPDSQSVVVSSTSTNAIITNATTTTLSTTTKVVWKEYTMEEIHTACNKLNQLYIIIHEYVYDISEFIHIHPGGSSILYSMIGKDCSDAYENYHSAYISRIYLKQYCIGHVIDLPKPLQHVLDFRNVRNELLRNNMFTIQSTYYTKLYIWYTCLFVLSLYLSIIRSSCIEHMVGAVIMGLFWQQLAGLGHDLGHGYVSQYTTYDHYIGSTIGCLLGGVSMSWWNSTHNTHHIYCNSIDHDPDIQHLPLLAVNTNIIQSLPFYSTYHEKIMQLDTVSHLLIQYQHYFAFPLILLARFNLYIQSWIYLFKQHSKITNQQQKNKNNTTITKKKNTKNNNNTTYIYIEFITLLLFLIWYLSIAIFAMPNWTQRILWVLVAHIVAGILHLQIIVSHWAMETYHGTGYTTTTTTPTTATTTPTTTNNTTTSTTNSTSTTNTTVTNKNNTNSNTTGSNIKTNSIIYDDWYCIPLRTTMDITSYNEYSDIFHIGLQYQIEHHMFPKLPRKYLRYASILVQQVCMKHNIPYIQMSFVQSLVVTYKALLHTAKYEQQHRTKELIQDILYARG